MSSVIAPFVLIRRISGSNVGPDFGQGDNPTRDAFKTKADIVKFVQEAVAAGAKVIQQQGDAGLGNTTKFFGNRLAHNSSIWTFAHRAQRRALWPAGGLLSRKQPGATGLAPTVGLGKFKTEIPGSRTVGLGNNRSRVTISDFAMSYSKY